MTLFKLFREKLKQRRLASIRSRIAALEAKRAKGKITEKEKSLLNTLRQYMANYQKRLNSKRAAKPLAKPSPAKAPAKPSLLNPPKPPTMPKRPTPPAPPKPAPKR